MVAVLLLNASYEPMAVLSTARAISLWLRGRVEAATDETVTLRGAEERLTLPIVLRLRHYVRVPKRGVAWSRRGVLRRDGYRCIYCGVGVGERRANMVLTKDRFTIDHIVPRSRGGRNTWGNTACACPACNQRKGNRTAHEAGMALLWEPKMPRVDYLVAEGAIPAAWKVYLEV